MQKIVPIFFVQRKTNALLSNNPPQTALWTFSVLFWTNKVSFVTPVFFFNPIYSKLWHIHLKVNLVKMKVPMYHLETISMASVIYCHQWLHLWHEALFMILLYKWPCFEVQKNGGKNITCTTTFLQRIWNYVVFPWN